MEILTTQNIGQTLGLIGLFVSFFAYKETNDKKLIVLQVFSSLFWGLHYGFLGLIAGAATNFFDISKNLICLKYKNKYAMYFFIISYLIIGVVSYKYHPAFITTLPIIASILGVVAIFVFKGMQMRILLLLSLVARLTHSIMGFSIAAMIGGCLLIGGTLYGMWKLKKES